MLATMLALITAVPAAAQAAAPISLHPDNPHYFLWRGEPTVLVTSAEHYGAVLNLDFDYVTYLDALGEKGLNLTRTFTGVYMEHPGAFNIANNTLAPKPNRLICPWARSDQPGYANGGNRFDLTRWDDAYFARLKDFVRRAGRRGVVVELVLFCPYYGDEQWNISPLKASNNVNGTPDIPRTEALTMKHPALVEVQDSMVRKIVAELRDADNLYYEICNEPYFGGVTLEWQRHIAQTIADAESGFRNRHLIAQNIANGSTRIEDPDPLVSIFNFHYSYPPDSVKLNHDLGKVIGFDETGFKGTADAPYRIHGWAFILAGGGVYDNLDYSFTVGHETGTFEFPDSQPGGGGHSLQTQLKHLKDFIHGFDFIRMKPDSSVVKGVPEGAKAYALVEEGKQYAIYVEGGTQGDLTLEAPAGRYRAEWLDPRTGQLDKTENVRHTGGAMTLASPPYEEDIALRAVRRR